jgi:hypothetical protein
MGDAKGSEKGLKPILPWYVLVEQMIRESEYPGRHTHFTGTAEILESALFVVDQFTRFSGVPGMEMLTEERARRIKRRLLSEHLFDFAHHVLLHADHSQLDALTLWENVMRTPDLSEWPEAPQE